MKLPRARWWYPILPAAALRLHDLGGQSYWTDEAISVQVSAWPWSKLLAYWQVDPHPPLHYLLIRLLERLGGTGECWLRLSSALAGIVAIALVCWILRRQFDDRTALVGGLLAALCPLHVWSSQELRGPALAGLFVAVVVFGLVRLKESDGRKGQWIVGVGLLLAFYAHYFTLFLLPLLLAGSRPVRRIAVAAFLGFLPWLPFAAHQAAAALAFHGGSSFTRSLVETMLYANAGHFPWLWPTWSGLLGGLLHHHFYAYVVIALTLVLPIFVLAAISGRDGWKLGRWFFVPAATAIVAGLFLPLFSPKYLTPFLPFLGAAAGVGYFRLWKQHVFVANILLAAALLVPAFSLVDLYANPLYRKTPWREALPKLTADLAPHDRVLFYSATDAADVRFYLDNRIATVDLWPDYASAQSARADDLRLRLAALAGPKIRHVILVDLNGAAYRLTQETVVSEMNRQRQPLPTVVLQPAMGVRWLAWGPLR